MNTYVIVVSCIACFLMGINIGYYWIPEPEPAPAITVSEWVKTCESVMKEYDLETTECNLEPASASNTEEFDLKSFLCENAEDKEVFGDYCYTP